jgi:hypothetical protein
MTFAVTERYKGWRIKLDETGREVGAHVGVT